MTAIVLYYTTLSQVLMTGEEWMCSVNPEQEDCQPESYVVANNEHMLFMGFGTSRTQPTRSISEHEFGQVKEVVFRGDPAIRVYRRSA